MNGQDCICKFVYRDEVGTHDTVTGEWLPDKPTTIVRRRPNVQCTLHGLKAHGYGHTAVHKQTPEEFWDRQRDLGNA